MSSFSVMLILTLGSYVVIICEGQDVYFGLKHRRKVAQVLDIYETDVTITCNVSCVPTASIQISNAFNTLYTESRSERGNSIDYLIPMISENFHFKCVVTYNMSASEITKEAYWSPHIIKEPREPYCYRNGTISQPYNIGDILLLGCFCDVQQLCKWIAVITGGPQSGEKVHETDLNFTSTPLNEARMLLQTVVGPVALLPAGHLKTYICISNVSYPKSQICVIQPLNGSAVDTVVTPTPTQSLKCNLSENFNVVPTWRYYPTSMVPTSNVPSSRSNYFLFITIGTASLLVILILVGLVVGVVVRVRLKVRKSLVDSRCDMRNEPSANDASELHLYDRSPNEGYPYSIPSKNDSPLSSSIKDKACVERTVDDKYDGAAYPYYGPLGIGYPEPTGYINVKPIYVNDAQF